MNDKLSFGIEALKDVEASSDAYTNGYLENLNSLKEEIEKLDTIWTSKETKTYEEFTEKFKEKLPKLEKLGELMRELTVELKNKEIELNDASKKTNESFM